MKSKILSFIMSLVTVLMIGVLGFLGLIVYNEVYKNDVVSDVQEFVSNITISSKGLDDDIKSPEVIEDILSPVEQENENVDYGIGNINKYFYNQLDEYSKVIYNALESNKENMKTGTYEIDLGAGFSVLIF